MRDSPRGAAHAANNMHANDRKRTTLFGVAAAMAAAALLAPTEASAQLCRGDPHTGRCGQSEGHACSPVDSGVEPGRCTTVNRTRGELECDCVGGRSPPPPDPCADRTAMGALVCRIDQPNVTQHESEYPNVVFAPGDFVQVEANGCVQTGGFGKTWKRYVNPVGNNADRLYHGLIRIPTGTPHSALVRINKTIGWTFKVTGIDQDTGINVPESQLFLHLGYEDDNYSDNGYYDHDDGNEDQCKTTFGHDGGPAHVTVKIFRGPGVSPDSASRLAQTGLFDFDVLWDSLDPNGLPLNPQWAWQLKIPGFEQIPNTSHLCHQFSQVPVPGPPANYLYPNIPDCTDQADLSTVDVPDAKTINGNACNIGWPPYTNTSFAGHVNWFPVTVEGHAAWGDHQVPDDDYTFKFTFDDSVCRMTDPGYNISGNRLSVNERCGLHVEFDSDETIDNWNGVQEWKNLHDTVDNKSKDDVRLLFDGHTILTGMFSLDGEHDLRAELHPLYAMATKRDHFENDPSDEVWLMFARNQGDEGFCSGQVWDAGFEDYTVRLPWREGMTSVDVNWDKTKRDFSGSDGTSGPTVAVLPPPAPQAGVYVSFHLGPPVHSSSIFDSGARIPFIYGALHLIWQGPQGPPAVVGPLASTPSAADEADEMENEIAAAINQLPPEQRRQVEKARAIAGTRTAVMHQLPATGPVRVLTEPPAPTRIGALPAIKASPATRKLARDAAQMRALCAATHNAPPVCHRRSAAATCEITGKKAFALPKTRRGGCRSCFESPRQRLSRREPIV